MVKNLVLVMVVAGLMMAVSAWAAEPQAAAAPAQPVVQPLLAVAQWQGKAMSLEDLKGSVAVVVFFNDDDG